jgi:prepilin-type N-terminal cleavage/methylation domain-containing protein
VKRMRKAFTLIELIVVIVILTTLIGLVTYGLSKVTANQKEKSTRTMMANLDSMLQEMQSTRQMKNLQAPILPPGMVAPSGPMGADVASSSHDIRFSSMERTHWALGRMMSVPANKSLLAKLPADNLLAEKPNGINVNYLDPERTGKISPPLPLDGWGNPILFLGPPDLSVGSGAPKWEDRYGLREVMVSGVPTHITNPRVPYPASATAPNAQAVMMSYRPFWASAGPDGDFSKGDDNVYSFEN